MFKGFNTPETGLLERYRTSGEHPSHLIREMVIEFLKQSRVGMCSVLNNENEDMSRFKCMEPAG